jgi:metal-sulfur cluster biosynthetic enzyme
MFLSKNTVMKKLRAVLDPELGISIIDMGFIYGVKIGKDNKVEIEMTLTTPGCPLYSMIEEEIKTKVIGLGAKEVIVKLTFDPPWSMDKMTKEGRKKLGF